MRSRISRVMAAIMNPTRYLEVLLIRSISTPATSSAVTSQGFLEVFILNFFHSIITIYVSMHSAIPETIADMIKITGISGVIHRAFALTEPKMNPA
ncbi:hypothetical protein BMS3Abin08_01806 [bacterium BMS3Abin08]|nr:hypothetical protein BMS3Abin08_01806 [bacterium BMS3Abin08]